MVCALVPECVFTAPFPNLVTSLSLSNYVTVLFVFVVHSKLFQMMEFTQHAALLVFILHAIRATAAHYGKLLQCFHINIKYAIQAP